MTGYWLSSFLRVDRGPKKLAKEERGQYPATLTEQAWSIKDFLRDTANSPERAR